MRMKLREDTVSLTDFARNTKKHTQEIAECGRPRILTQNGKAAAVVLSPEAFEKLVYEAEERRLDLQLRKAVEAYAAGERGIPAEEAFEKLEKRTGIRRKSRK
jgi:PHD/YefM family antitoxin component YafN of YafNO toxin-antitoxin module